MAIYFSLWFSVVEPRGLTNESQISVLVFYPITGIFRKKKGELTMPNKFADISFRAQESVLLQGFIEPFSPKKNLSVDR